MPIYHLIDSDFFHIGPEILPDVVVRGFTLPPGSFTAPDVKRLEGTKRARLTPDGWQYVTCHEGVLYRPLTLEDGSISATAKDWGAADFGTDPFADGWIASAPPATAEGETLGWDVASKAWTVTPETSVAKKARQAAAQVAARANMRMTAVELSLALFNAGKITGPEAEAFASTGAIPEGMLAAIEAAMTAAKLTDAQKTEARIKLKGLTVYERSSPLVPIMGAALQMDAAALDALFATKVA